MSVDGILFCLAKEPLYEVMSFGAGNNYSVAMFVSYGYNANLQTSATSTHLNSQRLKSHC